MWRHSLQVNPFPHHFAAHQNVGKERRIPLLDETTGDGRTEPEHQGKGRRVGRQAATAFIRKADESTIGKLIIEAVILLSARSQSDGGKVLRAAAQAYGVDTDAVALKVKQEFAAKEKARKAAKPEPKPAAKSKRAA